GEEKVRARVYVVVVGIWFVGIAPDERLERTRTLFENLFKTRTGGAWRPQAPAFEDYLQRRAQTLLRQQLALAGVAKLTGGWAEDPEEPEKAAGKYAPGFSGNQGRHP